jgi:beta-galactosidase/beta-glucuronidase
MNVSRAPVRVNPVQEHPLELRRKLSGTWQFALDPGNRGIIQEWSHPKNKVVFTDRITVPGFWQGQGFGRIEEKVIDFGITARTYRAAYEGSGWYARWFETPKD